MKGGLLIKEARLRAGLTQAALADRLDTSQPVIARWESNRRSPSFANVVRAVRACGLDLEVHLTPYDDQDLAQALQNAALTSPERLDVLTNMFEVEDWAADVRARSRSA